MSFTTFLSVKFREILFSPQFLMEAPGPARQKYRLAITTRRVIERQAAAQASSGAAGPAADAEGPSPHAKAVYDPSEFATLSTRWEGLKWRLISMPGGAVKKPDSFYKLYALLKQVTEGDNETPRPVWAERGGIDL